MPGLERGIRVLQALADGGDTSSMALARRLGISQSSCYRILQTLMAVDWIRPDLGGGFVFSLGLMPFVRPLVGLDRAVSRLRPVMEGLSRSTGFTVKLSVRRGSGQLTLSRVESSRPLIATSPVGVSFPVVLGASGACLLSGMDEGGIAAQIAHADRQGLWGNESAADLQVRIEECRRRGLCANIGRSAQGVDTLSAPVADAAEPLALTLVALRGDLKGACLPKFRLRLKEAAAKASALLMEDL